LKKQRINTGLHDKWSLGLGTHLFVKVPRPGNSERTTFSVLESSCYQSNHSEVEVIPLSALPKNTTSELAG